MGVAKFEKRSKVFKMEEAGNRGIGNYLHITCPYLKFKLLFYFGYP